MSLLDRIATDKDNVTAAEAALSAAKAQLDSDSATLTAIQPSLDLITQLEGNTSNVAGVNDLLEQVRALLIA